MTLAERRALLELCLDSVGGRVPVIMGCTAESTADSLDLVRHGARLGVRAAFGLLPQGQQHLQGDAQGEALRAHYLTLGEGSEIPIMVQEVAQPIPPELIVEIHQRCPNVRYVKEEAPDTGHRVTALIRAGGDRLEIFSGGANLLDDLSRGAIGAIPGSIGVADLSTAYNRHVQGDRSGARRAFNHFLPLSHWRRQFGLIGAKEVLRLPAGGAGQGRGSDSEPRRRPRPARAGRDRDPAGPPGRERRVCRRRLLDGRLASGDVLAPGPPDLPAPADDQDDPATLPPTPTPSRSGPRFRTVSASLAGRPLPHQRHPGRTQSRGAGLPALPAPGERADLAGEMAVALPSRPTVRRLRLRGLVRLRSAGRRLLPGPRARYSSALSLL